MICKMCATGADMQSRANELDDSYYAFAHALISHGLHLHEVCKGEGHCDCAHKEVRDESQSQPG